MTLRTIFVVLPLVFGAACGDNRSVPGDAPPPIDAAVPVDAALDASCFTNPQTYAEIINACTTAVKVFKDSHPPLLLPDGTVPPLPN
jgi:hypothetical protein